MTHSWFIIANPTSGNKNFSKKWKEIKQLLNQKNMQFSYAFTKYSKHEIELVHTAIKQGYRYIISVGGDGTLHHIVNGIMTQKYVKTSTITVAIIPLGTGNDWMKTYNIPNSIEKSINIIHQQKTILQDIGHLQLKNSSTYFNNVAGLGYDGYIVHKLNTLKRFGPIAYLLSGLAGLLFYKRATFKIEFNHKSIQTNCLMTLFGICKFSGGGMQFTKEVNTSDGLLDITIAKNLHLFDLIFNIRKLYNGSIVHHQKIETSKTKKIRVIPINSEPFIQADGELIGTGEVTVSILKKSLCFVIA